MKLTIGNLSFLSALLISVGAIGQNTEKNYSEEIRNFFISQKQFEVMPSYESSLIGDLVFKKFVKLNKVDFLNLKVSIPKYVIIDNKQINKSDEKKVKKRRDFINKNGYINEYTQTFRAGIEYSNLKFNFSNDEFLILGKEEETPTQIGYKKNNNINTIYNLTDNVGYNKFRIADTIIRQYTNNIDNKSYYVCELTNPKSTKFFAIFSEEDLSKSVKDRMSFYVKNESIIVNNRLSKLRDNSKNWLSGYFENIFPEGKLNVYSVSFWKYPKFKNKWVNIKDSMLVSSYAFSNIKSDKIQQEDFETDTSKFYSLKYSNHEFIKSFEVIELYDNGLTSLDTTYANITKPIGGNYWEKDEIQDSLFDYEKSEIYKSLSNHIKFNLDYYRKKMNAEYNPDIFLSNISFQLDDNGFKIGIDYIGEVKDGGIISFFDRIKTNSNYYEFSLTQYDNNLTVKKGISTYSREPNSGYNLKGVESEYDTRVDDISNGFKFTFTDPDFLTGMVSNNKETVIEKNSRLYFEETLYFTSQFKYELEKNAKKEDYKKQLIKKYGSYFVNKALDGNIVVGMPEGLLPIPLQFWNVDDNVTWGNGYRIYCRSIFGDSNKLSVTVSNGKVSSVSTW
jgi:hypothetical protein